MSWNDLSMADRAAYIKIGLDNGITNLKIIRDTYNKFAKGGPLNPYSAGSLVDAIYRNSKETRSKISNSSKGRTHVCSEEARNKIRESHLRNIASYKSQEFRDKISKAVDYKKSKVSQFTLEGEYLRSFSSANEAEKFTSVSRGAILRCCKGKVKRAGNFIWRYYGKGI